MLIYKTGMGVLQVLKKYTNKVGTETWELHDSCVRESKKIKKINVK